MDTSSRIDGLGAALFGKSRRAVLGLLYGHPDQAFYLRQIARTTGTGIGAVQRELRQLTDAGILLREKIGNQVHFQANKDCPVFEELKSLVIKTAGVADILKAALSTLSDRIRVAFLFGSMASANGNADSDVDVMIVGDVSFKEAVEALAPTQDALGREVNPVVYGSDEFEKKRNEGHHFVLSVLESPKIFLIGSEDDLGALGGKRLAESP
ncbi:MAG: nucleotidyltransferase domain-containing protein [Desulfobacterales bacterium]|nr:nucleotidyltransferase domain-containing protein [Desulfobacterales bacterium]